MVAVWIMIILLIAFLIAVSAPMFRKTKRVMQERSDVVEKARHQLQNYRKSMDWAKKDPDEKAILARCEDVYRQSVAIYNKSMSKLSVGIFARLMGYRRIPEKEFMHNSEKPSIAS